MVVYFVCSVHQMHVHLCHKYYTFITAEVKKEQYSDISPLDKELNDDMGIQLK